MQVTVCIHFPLESIVYRINFVIVNHKVYVLWGMTFVAEFFMRPEIFIKSPDGSRLS